MNQGEAVGAVVVEEGKEEVVAAEAAGEEVVVDMVVDLTMAVLILKIVVQILH